MIKKAHQKYYQENELYHPKGSANQLFAVWLMHEIIEHAVILIFMLTASVF